MTRRLCALALVLGSATAAHARSAPEWHYDLAGLVLQSDAIVEADRSPAADGHARYHVTRVIRGNVAVGADLDVGDQLYDTAGIEPHVVAFFKPATAHEAVLVPSGLRVTVNGHVFRYAQTPRLAAYARVPQGRDPVDIWQSGVTAVDTATFAKDLATAIARADALPAAIANKDRTALLALLAPVSDTRTAGAYQDVLAERVIAALVAAKDSEGALLAYAHDHSSYPNPGAVSIDDAIAIAKDTSRSVALRLSAIRAIRNHTGFYANVKAVEAMIALVPDPSRDVRAAAGEVAVLHGGYDARTGAEKATFQRLYKDARAALAKQFAVEADPTALAAIATALEMYPNTGPLPARGAQPLIAAQVELYQDELRVSVTCLHPGAIVRDGKVGATLAGKPAAMIPTTVYSRCDQRAGDDRAGKRTRLAAGRYAISVDVEVDGKRVVLDLGAVVSDANGELTILRP